MRLICLLFVTGVLSVPVFATSHSGDCGRERTAVLYDDAVDYEIACEAIIRAQTMTAAEYGYRTDAPIHVEFKPEVIFTFTTAQGEVTASIPVYGLYVTTENRVEMSAFSSQIVQNKDREHFGLKIKQMNLPVEEEDKLLRELHLSIVIHEITHLFSQHNFNYSKPSGAVHEYLSYVIQIKSLSDELRAKVLEANPAVFTNDMQINSMIHYFDPHLFGVKSYRHFEALGENRSAFLEDMLSGRFNPDLAWESAY